MGAAPFGCFTNAWWTWSQPTSLFEDGITRFDEAHLLVKQIFFGLLKPDFLATLNSVYS